MLKLKNFKSYADLFSLTNVSPDTLRVPQKIS